MNNPPFPQWTSLSQDAEFALPGTFAVKSSKFERKIRRRNMLEYVFGAFCIVIFGWVAWLTASEGAWLMTVGWITLIIGLIMVLTNMALVASNLERRPELDCRGHLRAQLQRQKEALESVTRWYLAPLVPGMVLVLGAGMFQAAGNVGWPEAALGAALRVSFGGIRWLNHRAARKLVDEIEQLDAL